MNTRPKTYITHHLRITQEDIDEAIRKHLTPLRCCLYRTKVLGMSFIIGTNKIYYGSVGSVSFGKRLATLQERYLFNQPVKPLAFTLRIKL